MGALLQGVKVADKIWRRCCALHIMLIEVDGLDEEWEGNIGLLDARVAIKNLPFALQ